MKFFYSMVWVKRNREHNTKIQIYVAMAKKTIVTQIIVIKKFFNAIPIKIISLQSTKVKTEFYI